MKKLLLIMCIFLSNLLLAQTDTAYTYTFGGIQNDVCNQIKPTWDGGYIMIGTTNSFGCGNTDFYAIKIDSLGYKQWSQSYGFDVNEAGYSVTPTLDKGYAFVGYTDSYGNGGYDVLLIKTDSTGNVKWQKMYGGSDWDFGYSISQLKDSGFVICGQTYSYGAGNGDVYVIRTDKMGDTLWTRTVGGTGYDIGNFLSVHEDSIYAIIGATTSYGMGDTNMFFILMDDKGIVKKDTTFGCTHTTVGNSIRTTLDNGYIIFGYTDSLDPGYPGEILMKMDSTGKRKWEQLYYAPGKVGRGKDAIEAADKTYLTVSTDNSNGYGGFAMLALHVNSTGYYIDAPSLGGTGDEQGNSVAIGKDSNAIFAGASNSTGYTVGVNDVLTVRWKNDDSVKNNRFNYIKNFHDTTHCLAMGILSPMLINAGVKLFPDPVSSTSTLLVQGANGMHYFLSVYNEAGQCMAQEVPLSISVHGQSVGHIEKGDLSAGVYFYKITDHNDATVSIGKFVIN